MRLILLVLIVAGLTRVLFLCASLVDPARRQLEPDSYGYLTLAQNLQAGRGFARWVDLQAGKPPVWLPELCRTPGYPGVLAAMGFLFGQQQVPTIILQDLLSVLLCVIGALIASKYFGRRAGLVAGMLLALDVQGAGLANLVLSDALCGVLLFASVMLIVRSLGSPAKEGWPIAAAGALLLGVSALVRPTSLVVWVAIMGYLLICALYRRRLGPFVTALVILVAGSIIPGAWILRNGRLTGEYTFTSIGRAALLSAHASGTLARADDISDAEACDRIAQRMDMNSEYVRFHALNPDQRSRLNTVVRQVILEHPKAFAIEWSMQTIKMLAGPEKLAMTPLDWPKPELSLLNRGPAEENRKVHVPVRSWLLWGVQIPYTAFVWLLFVGGLYASIRRKAFPPIISISVITAIAILAASSGSPGDERYRWPVVPLMILVGVSGFSAPARRPERIA